MSDGQHGLDGQWMVSFLWGLGADRVGCCEPPRLEVFEDGRARVTRFSADLPGGRYSWNLEPEDLLRDPLDLADALIDSVSED